MAKRHRPVRPRSLFTRPPVSTTEIGAATGEKGTDLPPARPPEGGSVTLEEIQACLGDKPELGGAADLGAGICDEGERLEDLAARE